MKVLWITSCLFPDICDELGIKDQYSGGWQYSSAISLVNTFSEINLTVLTPYNGIIQKIVTINRITYFLLPVSGSINNNTLKLESYLKGIQNQLIFDIVHIHGTEYPLGLLFMRVLGNKNVVVSIQGLLSIIERYYYGGIQEKELRNNITLRDYFKLDTIFSQKSKLQQQGNLEKELIKTANHIIGRTSWDKSHIWALNSAANYHFCNETLQDEFYQNNWNLNDCQKHSIFLSQAHYPLKGLQQMIKALPIILRHYPNTKIYVAGYNFVTNRGWRINGYGKYIQRLMNEKGIASNIIFTGALNVKEMCKRYLASHVFVCPSSIENSSNSIGEAQLLGIPCVASYVGGMADMIQNNETGILYRFEEVEMLAEAICHIFSNNQLAEKLSKQGRAIASIRHDRYTNANTLYSIYKSICKNL